MTTLDYDTYLAKAAKIKLAVFDVDGVLTNGQLILGESGNEYKCFHVRDGHGLVMLLETGCQVGHPGRLFLFAPAIDSGHINPCIRLR